MQQSIPDFTIMTAVGAVIIAFIYISIFSFVKEPNRQIINALVIAGAGATYWSGGLGVTEFPFGLLMLFLAFKGLKNYNYIALAWLCHTTWDLVHHFYANPIVPMEPTSSLGCAICDPILALWFFYKAPNIFTLFPKKQGCLIMYQYLLIFHSLFRWLVLLCLILAIYKAFFGLKTKHQFTKRDNAIRHWTATIAHIQLILGILLYSQSPIITYFWKNTKDAFYHLDATFFGLIHLFLMVLAIVFITIGSALAKRKSTDMEKFKTIFIYFSIALLLIFIAIPWPFSPFANRPFIRLQ